MSFREKEKPTKSAPKGGPPGIRPKPKPRPKGDTSDIPHMSERQLQEELANVLNAIDSKLKRMVDLLGYLVESEKIKNKLLSAQMDAAIESAGKQVITP